MADAPKDDKKPTPEAPAAEGFWDGNWVEKTGMAILILGGIIIVYKFVLPIFAAVPLGTWIWRLILIGCIGYGGYKSWLEWVKYIQTSYVEGLKWTLLYIKLPRTALRSPYTMEMVLNVLYQTGKTGSWRDLFWAGNVRPYHTLEMVSVEGKVYYFIRIYPEFAHLLKTQMYAQFPEIEITEVDDYVKYVPPYTSDSEVWDLYGYEIKKEKDDKMNAVIPIKSYVDYGLDKPGDAPERIDPMANIIEQLASLGPGEQYWIQIHVRAAADRFAIKDSKKKQGWAKEYAGFMKQYEGDLQKKIGEGITTFSEDKFKDKRITELMTDYEKKMYEVMQRHLAKNMFDVGIRCIYIAKKEVLRIPIHNGMQNVWRLFNQPGLNGLGAVGSTNPLAYDHPWENVMGSGTKKRKDNLYQAYIHRSYFYPPFNEYLGGPPAKARTIMLMSAEELATIFHFPGEEVSTGGLSRIEARKAEAPANLPIS